jgi:replication fork clamp-binding protein CrfC
MKNVVWQKGTGGLDGEFQSASEVDFYIDKDMIHIADTKVARRYGDFFIRNIHKFDEVIRLLNNYCLKKKKCIDRMLLSWNYLVNLWPKKLSL